MVYMEMGRAAPLATAQECLVLVGLHLDRSRANDIYTDLVITLVRQLFFQTFTDTEPRNEVQCP